MISYEDALDIVRAAGAARSLGVETLALADIPGRVCAEDIAALKPNQPFDNAAMDGFALRAADLAEAREDAPVALTLLGHIAAGDPTTFAPPLAGHCYEIMTGAVMPPGCDTVVPVEKTARDGAGRVVFRAPAGSGDHLRRAGEDFASGDPVAGRGTVFNPGHVLALATLGIGTARVLKAPRVAVISTGREVVDRPGEILAPGQIYNSTGPYLRAALGALGAGVTTGPVVPDDPRLFARTLSEAVESGADIVVSTGAVSAGVHDFVPAALGALGARIVFHKVAIKPGKPILFAQLPNGVPYFGLPGNPASTAAGVRFFLSPLMRALSGLPPEAPRFAPVKTRVAGAKGGLRLFVRGRMEEGTAGAAPQIDVPPGQQSFMVRPFTDTNGWGVVPENREELEAGERMVFFPDGG